MTDLTTSIDALPPKFEAVRTYWNTSVMLDQYEDVRAHFNQADAAILELLDALKVRDEMLERAAGMFAKRASTPLYKNRPNEWLADLRARAERGT